MPARSGPAHAPPVRWRMALALSAVALVLALMPASLAEGAYAPVFYPTLQGLLTGAANAVPFAVFDVAVVGLIAGVMLAWWSSLRSSRGRVWRAVGVAVTRTVIIAAGGVAWFELAWGLNYARPPVDVRLALPAGLPSDAEVAALLIRAVDGANRDHAAAHAEGFPGPRDVPPALAAALHETEAEDGRSRPTLPGRPKPTLAAPYFRMAGVDGLTAPPLLETVLNPDLIGPERPFVLAHEWAHLSGYAPEADANFVAWRVTQRATVASRYSGWLFLLSEAAHQVPRQVRSDALAGLTAGPREDLGRHQPPRRRPCGHRAARRLARVRWLPAVAGRGRGAGQLFAGRRAHRPQRTGPRFVPRAAAALTNQTAADDVSEVTPSRQGAAMSVRSAVLAAVLAVVASPPLAAQPAPPAFTVPYEYFTLPNGLKVVVSPDHTAPVVLVEVMYNIGFRVEPKGRTGFAHLFEHMMFQGSGQLKKLEHIQYVSRAGGSAQRLDPVRLHQLFRGGAVQRARSHAVARGRSDARARPHPGEPQEPAERGQ